MKPLRRVSKRRAVQLVLYAKMREEFLARNPRCAVIPYLAATEIHHVAGRRGARLLDTQFWLAVSRTGHRWIHDNPAAARVHGWLKTR